MKKFKTVSLALLLSFSIGSVISCSSTSDPIVNPVDQFNIVGIWKQVKGDVYTNGTLTSSTPTLQDNNSCPDYTEFKSDGTFVEIGKDANCVVNSTDGGTYSFNSNTKILTATYAGSSPDSGPLNDITPNSFNVEFSENVNGNTYKYKDFYVKIN